MRINVSPGRILLLGAALCLVACANAAQPKPILALGSAWGSPEYSEYGDQEKTQEWRYTRTGATLIISHTACAACKEVTEKNVDAHRQDPNSQAILVVNNNISGILRLTSSPKGVSFMIYEFYAAGVYYSMQIGLNNENTSRKNFELQQEFFANIRTQRVNQDTH